jgi:hypothetical protein
MESKFTSIVWLKIWPTGTTKDLKHGITMLFLIKDFKGSRVL